MSKERRNLLFAITLSVFPLGQCFPADASDNPESGQTGRYTYSGSMTEILGADGAAAYSPVFPVDQVQHWEIVVPEDYDPNDPPGILVYISPSDSGKIPRNWTSSIETENLIWIAAKRSGNKRAVARRIAYSILAAGIIDRRYKVNASRIYLAGFSGGAKVAGLVAVLYPNLFSGAIYIGGAELWDEETATVDIDSILRNRYVFMAGTDDFNRPLSRKVFSKYTDLGIENIEFVVMTGKGHQLPETRQFTRALQFLDGSQPPESGHPSESAESGHP